MAKTNTSNNKAPLSDWSVEELYDLLMYDIEPELISSMLPHLDQLYEGEMPDQHEVRMEHYRQSFLLFYERFDMLLTLWKDELEAFRKEVFRQFEEKVGTEEGGTSLNTIENTIQKS